MAGWWYRLSASQACRRQLQSPNNFFIRVPGRVLTRGVLPLWGPDPASEIEVFAKISYILFQDRLGPAFAALVRHRRVIGRAVQADPQVGAAFHAHFAPARITAEDPRLAAVVTMSRHVLNLTGPDAAFCQQRAVKAAVHRQVRSVFDCASPLTLFRPAPPPPGKFTHPPFKSSRPKAAEGRRSPRRFAPAARLSAVAELQAHVSPSAAFAGNRPGPRKLDFRSRPSKSEIEYQKSFPPCLRASFPLTRPGN